MYLRRIRLPDPNTLDEKLQKAIKLAFRDRAFSALAPPLRFVPTDASFRFCRDQELDQFIGGRENSGHLIHCCNSSDLDQRRQVVARSLEAEEVEGSGGVVAETWVLHCWI